MRTFYALFMARNKEFMRDRGTLAWNFLFPFLAVFALAFIFSGDERALYKVAVTGAGNGNRAEESTTAAREFLETRYIHFVPTNDLATAQNKVRHHQFDMALDLGEGVRYWINPSNPKGYFLERALWGSGNRDGFERGILEGREIRYVDWLLPGILGMNVMVTCLWGVGYVMVRYRKAGILRRLKASPVSAMQFISAQIASRMILVIFVTTVLFFGMDLLLDFFRLGSLLDLFVVLIMGAICHIALAVLISARTQSQELAGGLLNLATWPMMFLSGVWFSLEGSSDWLLAAAKVLPLTHMVNGARKILLDGATLATIWPEVATLAGMSAVFLIAGSVLFRWE